MTPSSHMLTVVKNFNKPASLLSMAQTFKIHNFCLCQCNITLQNSLVATKKMCDQQLKIISSFLSIAQQNSDFFKKVPFVERSKVYIRSPNKAYTSLLLI